MTAKLKFACACGKSLTADATAAGKRAKCPNCGQVIQIPQPMQSPIVSDDSELGLAPLDDLARRTTTTARPASPIPAARSNRPTPDSSRPPLPSERSSSQESASRPRSGSGGPPPLPASAQSAGGKSIWDDEDEYALQTPVEPPCPNCGAAMPPGGVVCVHCGYNRRTATMTARQPTDAAPSQRLATRKWFRRKAGSGGLAVATRAGFISLFLGGGLLYAGIQGKRLADASSQQPETISLKQLVARGPDGNPNIVLTDFELCNNFVYAAKSVGGLKELGGWTKVWVPIVPRGDNLNPPLGAVAPAGNVQALIYSSHVGSQAELPKLAVAQLRGMVTNRIESLGVKEKQRLQEAYPGINFDRCLIIDEGREPLSAGRTSLLIGGGGLLAMAGVVLIAKRFLLG